MVLGIVFIVCGILILIYPKLLAIVVACTLIFWGISFVAIGYQCKKASRSMGSPYADFIFRF